MHLRDRMNLSRCFGQDVGHIGPRVRRLLQQPSDTLQIILDAVMHLAHQHVALLDDLLHFLLLGARALGHVVGNAEHADRAIFHAHGRQAHVDVAHAASRMVDARRQLRAHQPPHSCDQPWQGVINNLHVFEVHMAHHVARIFQQLGNRRTDQRRVARVDVQGARKITGHDEHELIDVFGELAESGFGFAQRGFGAYFLGQIVDDRHHVACIRIACGRRAAGLGFEQRHHALIDRQPLAVGAQHHIARPVDLGSRRKRLAIELRIQIGKLARIDFTPRAADDLLARQACHRLAGAIQADEAPRLGFAHGYEYRQIFDDQIQVVAHAAQLFFRSSARIDVDQRQDDATIGCRRVDRPSVARTPESRAVGAPHPPFERNPAVGRAWLCF